MLRRYAPWLAGMLLTSVVAISASGQQARQDVGPVARRAEETLDKAISFLRTKVATEGGYLWKYSEDLEVREGERKATTTQAWVQPPGTPTVGLAFVEAYEATHSEESRKGMMEAASTLIRGQLRSGGWGPHVEFDPELRREWDYRVEGSRGGSPKNVSSLDDNTTQAATLFLMRADKALNFKNGRIHEAAEYALRGMMSAQYSNGGWPQKFNSNGVRPNASRNAAAIPNGPMKPWGRNVATASNFNFNDHLMDRMIEVFLSAADIYDKPEYADVAKRTGDFILQARFPDPQPGWAQQYDSDMQPAWARYFEPPSLATSESQGLLDTLMLLYERTGDTKYLRPIPSTLSWLRRSVLPSGKLPRFVEFKTNQPLYVDTDKRVSNNPAGRYTGYAWDVENRVEAIQRKYERLERNGPSKADALPRGRGVPEGVLAAAKRAIDTADEQGRWVETGTMRAQGDRTRQLRLISMQTAAKNITALARLLYFANPE